MRGAGPGPQDDGGAQPSGGGAPRPHGDALGPESGVSRVEADAGRPHAPGLPQPVREQACPPRARAGRIPARPVGPAPELGALTSASPAVESAQARTPQPPPIAHVSLAQRGWNQIQPAGR